MGIPAVTNGEYRLAFGTYTEAEMIAEANYLIRLYPHASPGRPWQFITDDIITPYVERTPNGLNFEVMQGLLNFKASFSVLNDRQLFYLWVQRAARNPTPLVTVVTRNRLQGTNEDARWCTVNCTMRFPPITGEGLGSRQREWVTSADGGLTFEFYDGTYTADSGTNFGDG